jgi:hypothetical protein
MSTVGTGAIAPMHEKLSAYYRCPAKSQPIVFGYCEPEVRTPSKMVGRL